MNRCTSASVSVDVSMERVRVFASVVGVPSMFISIYAGRSMFRRRGGAAERHGSAPVHNLPLVLPPHLLYNRFTGYPRIQYKQHDNDFAVSHRSSRSMISLTLARGMSANED